MAPASLSVVIPAFNEARGIERTLAQIAEYAAQSGGVSELIVVDDGSTDGTADVVRAFQPGPLRIQLLVVEVNRGKGHAVCRGMLAATGDAVLMCDADLSTPIEELEKLRSWLERGYDVVIASRDLPESRLDPPQPRLRRWLAWLFRAVRRRLLVPELRDTQCGFKLFTQAAARAVFVQQTLDGWLFDCEVLAIAERLGCRIKEVGVTWRDRPHSRVKPLREAVFALPTLLAIRRRLATLFGDLALAHKSCFANEDCLARSEICGCFYCLAIFPPHKVATYVPERDGRRTGLCPRCGIDSVLGSASGFPITRAFLRRMRRAYF